MEIEQILPLIASADIPTLRSKLTPEKVDDSKINDYLKEYQPETHKVAGRPDKIITIDDKTKSVPVAKLPIPMQKKIVQLSAAFLCANPVQISATPKPGNQEYAQAGIVKTWTDCKLDYKTLQLAEILMSETEVAELWYLEAASSDYWDDTPFAGAANKLRMRILANSLGDTLYPSFNAAGDMNAFGRAYFIKTDYGTVQHFDLFTDDKIYLAVNNGTVWTVTGKENPIGKIPVIYYRQARPEWMDVQALIDRFEMSISRHGDANDYFGAPTVTVSGEIEGFAEKGEDGKVLQLKNGAEAKYLTWDQSPESVKLEQENLRSLIYDMTDTPDISFQQMKGLGTYSGFAIKMLFTSAHLKAGRKEGGVFGESIQRRLNFIKAAITKVIKASLKDAMSMEVKPVFTYFLPQDIQADVETLVSAVSGGVISQETAVKRNPLVENAEQEMKLIKGEENEQGKLNNLFNEER